MLENFSLLVVKSVWICAKEIEDFIISDALRSVLEAYIFENFPGSLDGAARRKVSEFSCGLPSE